MSHYDMGNDFFRLVLDPEMIYSCALFAPGDDLSTAQMRKLDHHIEAAGATNKSCVRDIGCGWGAMLRRLIDHACVGHAVGLTLSPSQAQWIRKIPNPKIEVREQDWRDHKPERRYDAIVSVGAFEHFVHKGLDPKVKLGPGACPFNYLYWNFLIENEPRLSVNPRMALPYRTLARMPAPQRAEIVRVAQEFLGGQVAWQGDPAQGRLDAGW